MIHPGEGEEAPLEILDILEAAGADVSHTAIAHMDRTVFRDENVLKLARRGCYIEYDLFGTECSHYQVHEYTVQWCPSTQLGQQKNVQISEVSSF